MGLRHLKKRISLIFPKFGRTIRRDIFQMSPKMTREEREISAMIGNLLSNQENRIIYSIKGKSIRIQTKDKKYVISLSSDHIKINFVTISLNERICNSLVDRVIERMELDIDDMDNAVIAEQKEFLSDINNVFIKTNVESNKKFELIKNASSEKIGSTLSRILIDPINK